MPLMFSCICNQPERLLMAVEPVRSVLRADKVARWGLGYVQAGEVLLSRHPRPVEEFDFFEAMGGLKSDYVIGMAVEDDDLRGNANTQPFRFRRWMFAQESTIGSFEGIQDDLKSHLPGFLQRNIKGKSLPEYVFHVFLSLLHDSSQIDDPNLDPSHTAAALRAALVLVQKSLKEADIEGELGNVIISNSRSMVAARLAGPLFLRRLRYQEDPKRPDTEFRSVLLTSATDNPGEGFEELPPRSILNIRRDVSTDIVPLDSP